MEQFILNTDENQPVKNFVLVEDDSEKVVAIIEAKVGEDILPKVLQAIKEDYTAHEVTFNSRIDIKAEANAFLMVDITMEENDEESDLRDYSLYLTAKY